MLRVIILSENITEIKMTITTNIVLLITGISLILVGIIMIITRNKRK